MKKTLIISAIALLLGACADNSYDPQIIQTPWMATTTSSVVLPATNIDTTVVSEKASTSAATNTDTSTSQKKASKKAQSNVPMDQAAKLRQTLKPAGARVQQSENKIVLILPAHVAFGENQTTIQSSFEPVLASVAKTIKEYDKTKIQIIGYTDNVGTVAENTALSLRRANAVSNFLRLNGVDINRIIVDGLGPENPIATNVTNKGREQNRRVEITLTNIQ